MSVRVIASREEGTKGRDMKLGTLYQRVGDKERYLHIKLPDSTSYPDRVIKFHEDFAGPEILNFFPKDRFTLARPDAKIIICND